MPSHKLLLQRRGSWRRAESLRDDTSLRSASSESSAPEMLGGLLSEPKLGRAEREEASRYVERAPSKPFFEQISVLLGGRSAPG